MFLFVRKCRFVPTRTVHGPIPGILIRVAFASSSSVWCLGRRCPLPTVVCHLTGRRPAWQPSDTNHAPQRVVSSCKCPTRPTQNSLTAMLSFSVGTKRTSREMKCLPAMYVLPTGSAAASHITTRIPGFPLVPPQGPQFLWQMRAERGIANRTVLALSYSTVWAGGGGRVSGSFDRRCPMTGLAVPDNLSLVRLVRVRAYSTVGA